MFQKEVQESFKVLKQGGVILYPTDTVWGIGCDATNEAAVEKVFKLKQRHDSKALICLVADDRMLKKYVKKIPDAAFDIMDIEDNPITIIYDEPLNLAKNLIAEDNTIAIRIPDNDFCFQLLRKFNGAIVSTSANISGQATPKSFKEIHEDILKGVDYVVNLPDEKIGAKPSSIIKLSNDGKVQVIRK
ncbi:MAG: threonylcarbamoyl-AMP synthase [Xanthomarina sp.]|uniref:L-threonylcarbamoyladenylate synthase n=1 Tax=Xanthomarina sp. TaxID=1931211 RepID=UPI000C4089C0|nr:L-threonylcarbamoyladenylate synthase [Xanthomarina sp.]MAL22838.1 threonylcarbamoyl-AMP synthase [Xanthomarina sp.]MBF62373.1 threonylcarbamoyl-AMP synthase [Xanthomarina sp.]HAB26483.1 threonylcarbamoyl-AMP synthase [Xanthomarina gelatinilytica]|tara:strand:+ start:829 stop:1392 length:564 start_codon:yes stop_codon:yes gene_type:complete